MARYRAQERLEGVGLGLYRLRSREVVGREAERDELWRRLVSVHRGEGSQVVVLSGAPGVGKSSLARWLTTRAHEVGAASVMVATHSRVAGPSDGLSAMLAREYGCEGLDLAEQRRRVSARLQSQGVVDPEEVRLVLDAINPANAEQGQRPELATQLKWSAMARVLMRQASQRPVILWIDDAQWADDALSFLDFLYRDVFIKNYNKNEIIYKKDKRIFVLLTWRGEERSWEWSSWLSGRGVELELGQLDVVEHRGLVEGLLVGLTGDLVEEVATRTEGNPLFATQLVDDWVERGVLVSSPLGFALKEGVEARLPDTIHQVFLERVSGALEGFLVSAGDERERQRAWRALSLAVVLGRRFEVNEWEALCEEQGWEAPGWVLERLGERGLLSVDAQRGEFVHGLLCESLERDLKNSGEWSELNERVAGELRRRYGRTTVEALVRQSIHFLEAQRIDEALEVVYDAVSSATPERGMWLVERVRRAMEGVGEEVSVHQRGQLALLEGMTAMVSGDSAASLSGLLRASELFEQVGDERMLVTARSRCAWQHFYDGEFGVARELACRGLEGAKRLEARELEGNIYRLLGNIECFDGNLERAYEELMRAVGVADELASAWNGAWSRYELAMVCLDLGPERYEEASEWLEEATRRMERMGERVGLASCALLQGSLSSLNMRQEATREQWQQASQDFERALELLEPIEEPGRFVARENLGRACLQLGQAARGREHLEVVAQAYEAEASVFANFVYDALMWASLMLEDWAGFQGYLKRCEEFMEREEHFLHFNLYTLEEVRTRLININKYDKLYKEKLEKMIHAVSERLEGSR
jgi:tetratricopeptide (TPR) repeat protein